MSNPKKRSEKQRRATAYHEAGHAVMAYVLGRPFRRVSITTDEDSLGHVLYRKWDKRFDPNTTDPERARLKIERAIMTAFAGHEAEFLFTGRRNHVGSRTDTEAGGRLATYIIDDWEIELPAFLKWLRIRTRNILNSPQHWRAVEDLAVALLEKEEMSVSEAQSVISQSFRKRWSDEELAAWHADEGI